MAVVLKDRVKETTSTTGTSNFVLGGSSSGYQPFSVIGANNYTYYCCYDQATGDWEVGYGQYTTTAGGTLVRNTVLSNSAATTSKIVFAAGPKDVFITYPAEKAIYEEPDGNTLIDGGPLTIIGSGVTGYTSLAAALGEMYADINSFAQFYAQNQNDGSDASTDFVVENDLGTDTQHYADFGINSSNFSSASYPIYDPNSGYLYVIGDGGSATAKLFVGSGDDDVVIHAGGFTSGDIVVTFSASTKNATFAADVNVTGALDVTGAATFGSTVLLNANPTTALQAATKAYVDNQVTAGLHIHNPVLVETTGNLTATYAQGGTTFNITDITSGTTVTTSVNHGLSVNDQIWLYNTAGNGLSTNTAYFVYSVPAANQLTLSLTYGGAQVTGLTNASGLTYNTRANSGVGATLTNSGAQAALSIDGVSMSTNDRVMVRLQTTGYENGVYVVTTVGNGSTNWVLTRATDANKVEPSDPNGLGTGDYFYTQSGTLNAGDSHVLTTEPNTMIIGYTTLTYTQFSGSVDYTGGTNIDVTGQVISLTGTVAATNGGTGTATVATGDLLYGSATNTWSKLAAGSAYKSLVMNAGGTNVEWNAVALNQSGAVSGALGPTNGGTGQSAYSLGDIIYSDATNSLARLAGNTTTTKKFLGQTGTGSGSAAPSWQQPAATDITGLAPSATTDTTNADNITSGTLGTARLSGSYTGITGVGTLTAGTWNGSTIGATYGGTGLTSYAVGDLLYADTTTSLAKLADVAVGNALISGGVGSAPSYGKIGLDTHVSGTLPVANGGTGATAATAYAVLCGGTTSTSAFQSVAGVGTAGQVLTSNGAGALPTFQAAGGGFPSGTRMMFAQTSAPTGWTKDTVNYNNHALRVVTGAASSGGTVDFTTAFTSQGVSGTNASTTATNQSTTATNLATTATNQATTQGGSVSTSTSVSLSAGGSVSATTLVESQIPSHTHRVPGNISNGGGSPYYILANTNSTALNSTNNYTIATGGSGSHTHGFSNPSYTASSSSSFTGSSHNHTQDAHNHTQNAHTHTQDAHTHTFTGTAINLAVKYLDVITATKD